MKVNVQSVNFNVDKKLLDFVENKVGNLDKFFDKVIGADVYLKVINTSEKENKVTEIKVNIPGDEMIVKKQCKTFEEGIDIAIDSLKRQLNKKKEKLRSYSN
jgi:putative sigma-54 modulation protein